MKRSTLTTLALFFTLALAATRADAQPSYSYFQAVTNLGPVAYWPMHETTAPAIGDIETNYGTLGALGTGYYPDWLGTTSLIQRNQPGAIAGDSDASVFFAEPNSNAGGPTNALVLPHTSPLTTLVPPFSVECWFNGFLNNLQGDIWSQSGFEGLNAGNLGGGAGNVCGIRLYWNAPKITVYNYRNSSTLNTVINASGYASNTWYHLVVTCDAQTNFTLWVNGNVAGSGSGAATYAADYWSPFEVGNGRGNTRALKGFVDEVAIYTNVLQDVNAHYTAGITSGSNPSYFQTVLNDNPVVYYRMDGPAYSAPALATWPVVNNYGTTGGNGVYSPGTVPGAALGPSSSSGKAFSGLPGVMAAPLSGVNSYADVGNSSAFNPTGPNPFSVI
ncbi:MAG TPA: LamG-like jellyroll fold domain-containing protein, partial [Verrucomicrobiae bacterium]|nr:LamG-like jellyroll fold domain-containing protein [Verrucomicrobiae bacterium]